MGKQDYCCTACNQPWITHCTLAGFTADGTPKFVCGPRRAIPDPGVKCLVGLYESADDAIAPVAIAEAHARKAEAELQKKTDFFNERAGQHADAAKKLLDELVAKNAEIAALNAAVLAKDAELRQLADRHAEELSRIEARHAQEIALRANVAELAKETTDELIKEIAGLRKDAAAASGKTLEEIVAELGGPIGPEQADALSDLKAALPDPGTATEPPPVEPTKREDCQWCNASAEWSAEYIGRDDGITYVLLACDIDMHMKDMMEHLAENAKTPDQYATKEQITAICAPCAQPTANPSGGSHA